MELVAPYHPDIINSNAIDKMDKFMSGSRPSPIHSDSEFLSHQRVSPLSPMLPPPGNDHLDSLNRSPTLTNAGGPQAASFPSCIPRHSLAAESSISTLSNHLFS